MSYLLFTVGFDNLICILYLMKILKLQMKDDITDIINVYKGN